VSAITVDLSMQYCGSGTVGPHVLAEAETLRKTGRLSFIRLTIGQEDNLIAASTATIRKAAMP
jgi:acyl-coenzyme A thioesterase PaaI-like protein